MRTTVDTIQVGWSAYDEAGEVLGDVAGIGRNYVHVRNGLMLRTDVYIPSSHVDSIDARDSSFTVAVLKEDVESLGWENPPTDSTDPAADTATTGSTSVPCRS